MKILVTGGGTKVKIDDIRSITNEATGSFPAKIAKRFLEDNQVDYLISNGGIGPFTYNLNFYKKESVINYELSPISNIFDSYIKFKDRYNEYYYETYQEYYQNLVELLKNKPDVVFLGAAVSDYGCDPEDGKISSNKNSLTIKLGKLPKIISTIKSYCPKTILVGFKLLYDVTDDELIAAAKKSIVENGCDFVIANDYKKLKAGNKEMILVGEIVEKLDNSNNKVDHIYTRVSNLYKLHTEYADVYK